MIYTVERKWLKRFPRLAPEKVMEQFIPLLGAAWEKRKNSFNENDLEDSITRTLFIEIQKETRIRHIAWGIHSQPEILEEQTNGHGKIIGRCDITISVANHEYIYECKRLWPEGKSKLFTKSARLYIIEGLCRFLQPAEKQFMQGPQYPSWLRFAGMLGYVMDGRVPEALATLQKTIATRVPPQELESPCSPHCPTKGSHHFRSTHINCIQMVVHAHHILLPVSSPS